MRKCCKCGKEHLTSGFVLGDGEAYYCSEECLYQNYTEQQYIDMYEGGYAYWTEWEDDPHADEPHAIEVTIEKTVAQTFEVKANSLEEALKIAADKYRKGEFVLEPGECQRTQMLAADGERHTDWIGVF